MGANDRLIRPAILYTELTVNEPVYLASAIAAALLYKNEADEEAVRLQEIISDSGYKGPLRTISGLETIDPLVNTVIHQVEKLLNSKTV